LLAGDPVATCQLLAYCLPYGLDFNNSSRGEATLLDVF